MRSSLASRLVRVFAVTINMVAKDFSFTLSRRSVPKGAQVTFRVRNAGAVVHDLRLPDLAGRLLIGDYCTGEIEAVSVEGGKVADRDTLGLTVPEMSSFGVDGQSRVYVTSTTGAVYRLDPA